MFPLRTATIILLVCILKCCDSYPAGTNVLRLFYEKPEVNLIQGKLIQITKPQPIVDTIKETEKCCNTQQHLIGRKFLNVYESVTGALANVAQVPRQSADKIGATVTLVLNNVGGKLVGLQ